MDRILARLERPLGRFAIPNLPAILALGTAGVLLLSMVQPRLPELLWLDPFLVRRGQVWRLVTHLLLPDDAGDAKWSFLTLFTILVTWTFGVQLERRWGTFKLNAYYFLGALGTTAVGMLGGRGIVGSFYLDATILFAYATLEPNTELLLFFVLPTPVKYIALATVAYFAYEFVTGTAMLRLTIAAATINYFLFFGGALLAKLRGQGIVATQTARREAMRASREADAEYVRTRTCAICGASQEDGADIRVCTCEKCAPRRELCLEHARSH